MEMRWTKAGEEREREAEGMGWDEMKAGELPMASQSAAEPEGDAGPAVWVYVCPFSCCRTRLFLPCLLHVVLLTWQWEREQPLGSPPSVLWAGRDLAWGRGALRWRQEKAQETKSSQGRVRTKVIWYGNGGGSKKKVGRTHKTVGTEHGRGLKAKGGWCWAGNKRKGEGKGKRRVKKEQRMVKHSKH